MMILVILMRYKVIATGSTGNAVIVGKILIDCGVSFKKIAPYIKYFDLVLITHKHTDHLNFNTLKKIQEMRPSVRVGVCDYLLPYVKGLNNIDMLEIGKIYDYKAFKVSPIKLYHNVPNVGYRLYIEDKKVLYATDTNTLDGIQAKNYDLYLIEGNYSEVTIDDIIAEKLANGKYAHEIESKKNHLSIEKAEKWLEENANNEHKVVFLHKSKGFRRV